MPPITTNTCPLRPIRFLELWEPIGWRIKVYGIAYDRPLPHPQLVAAGKQVAQTTLATLASNTAHYRVGFLGVHEGRTGNFVFVDWWADENELHHHVFISPNGQPLQLVDRTATGPAACVWDLRVMGFERDAWLSNVLRNANGPDIEAYLEQRLNEDA